MEEKCKAPCEIGSVKSRDQTGEDIHRVMGGQYQDGKCFEEYDSDGTNGEPTHPETGEFDGAQDCDGGMPGKEVIIGHAVGYEQRWKARMVPDCIGRGRQGYAGLHDLAQAEHDDESHKGPWITLKDPTRQKKNSQQINDARTDNQQGVRRCRLRTASRTRRREPPP